MNETRDFLYMGIGWELMDLRQDIEFYHHCMEHPYPVEEIISSLLSLQRLVSEYADEHFPRVDDPVEAF